MSEGSLVEGIADEAKAEDSRSEAIACSLGAATEESGENLVAIFCWAISTERTEGPQVGPVGAMDEFY